MGAPSKTRATIKFLFWMLLSAVFIFVIFRSYMTGQMARWYYHKAGMNGYAVNADSFHDATTDSPATLAIEKVDSIEGLVAVPVKKGDILPANANGIISEEVLAKGKRARLDGETVKVSVPWEIKESKGFKFKDTFKHKGIETYPWGAVWNVFVTLGLGLSLGFMAEGLTEVFGLKLEKIRHFEGH